MHLACEVKQVKMQFTYGFTDEPQYRYKVYSRQWLANYLRACRSQSYRDVRRIGPHAYAVCMVNRSAVAHILPVQL